jgi:hypothetical protein
MRLLREWCLGGACRLKERLRFGAGVVWWSGAREISFQPAQRERAVQGTKSEN